MEKEIDFLSMKIEALTEEMEFRKQGIRSIEREIAHLENILNKLTEIELNPAQ